MYIPSAQTFLMDADKRVYLLKLAHTLITVLSFIIGHNITGSYEVGMLIAVTVAMVVTVVVAIMVVGPTMLAALVMLAVVGTSMAARALSIPFSVAFSVAFSGMIISALTDEDKYNMSEFNNLLSTVAQLLLTRYLLHLAQYLRI